MGRCGVVGSRVSCRNEREGQNILMKGCAIVAVQAGTPAIPKTAVELVIR